LIYFQCLLEIAYSSLTWSHHQSPFNLFGLNLACPFEIKACLFVHTLLHIINTQPGISVNICGQQSIWLQIIMQSLLLIILPEKYVPYSCQNSCIIRQFCQNYLIPFQSLFSTTNNLINVCNLEYRLRYWYDCLNFLECLCNYKFTWRASIKLFNFLFTYPKLYNASTQSA
jgi:hypothetical protein